jgi:hypothetical protein
MKTRLFSSVATGLAAASPFILGAIASAGITNGGFESGFSGWTYVGNGGSSATNSLIARDPLHMGQQQPFSGEWAPTGGDHFAALWSTDSITQQGASLSQSFTASGGDRLEFDLFYDFGDFGPSTDPAFVSLRFGGQGFDLAKFNMDAASHLDDDTNVGWTHYSMLLPPSPDQTYELLFWISDSSGSFESILGVDEVMVTPTPGSAVLLLTGMAMLRRRRA